MNYMTTAAPKDKPSPRFLNKEEMKILQEPEVYRKMGEKVEDALYRDYIKRTARSKLIKQTKLQLEEQSRGVKVTIKSQQMAVQKFERDLEQLIKKHSSIKPGVGSPSSHWARNVQDQERVCTRNQIIQILTEAEVFREVHTENLSTAAEQNSAHKARSVSPIQPWQKSLIQHRRIDSYRKTTRLKQEMGFLNTLWSSILCPSGLQSPVADLQIVNEAFKVLFNHYLPSQKQVQLLSELQTLVSSMSQNGAFQQLSTMQIEENLVKAFQTLYPHYFDLNNITKVVNVERTISNIKEHYKEYTFQPKISQESINMDLQNISQIYAKIAQEGGGIVNGSQQSSLKQAQQVKEKGDADPQPNDISDDDMSRSRSKSVSNNRKALQSQNAIQSYLKKGTASNKGSVAHSRQGSNVSRGKGPQIKIQNMNAGRYVSPKPPSALNQISFRSVTPDKDFRFEYLYQQQTVQKEKIKQRQEEKARQDLQGCTFKPALTSRQQKMPYWKEHGNESQISGGGGIQTNHISPAKRFEALSKLDVEKRQQQQKQSRKQQNNKIQLTHTLTLIFIIANHSLLGNCTQYDVYQLSIMN